MFDTRFNNGYQNTVMPLNTDPYADQYLNQMPQKSYGQDPYAQGNVLPNMMSSNIPYPVPPSQSVAPANAPSRNTIAYADGGSVKKQKGRVENSPYPMLAEMIRKQGKGEDTILAHINPLEAMILKDMGGSGTINKKTGLPQFQFGGIFSERYWKKGAWKRDAAAIAGNVIGNMIAPGFGGVVGSALGSAAGTKIRGRNDYAPHMLKSAAISAIAPTVAGLAGTGANAMGATNVGHALTKYGNVNAILPSLGFGNTSGGERLLAPGGNNMSSYMGASSSPQNALASSITNPQGEMSFTDKLLGNTKDYLSQPGNLLTLGSLAGSLMNRPKEKKEKTPEQQAAEEKRLAAARMLNPTERSRYEADLLAEAQMRRRIARQKFLPEEALGTIEPMYRRSNTPGEYAKENKWLNYYNNPEFSGKAMLYKEGGNVHPRMMYEAEEMEYPSGLGRYIAGDTNGQDDKIQALLSDGEYVMPADVVAHLGDGNNAAGAKKLDMALKNIRKQKGGIINKLPPKAKSLASYLK